MKLKQYLIFFILAVNFTASAYASIVRIDFTGVVMYQYDSEGNVLSGEVNVGDAAIGRIIYDDSVGMAFKQSTDPTRANYVDPSLSTNWIDASITVNGRVYNVNPMGATPTDSDYILLQNAPWGDDIRLVDERLGDMYSANSYNSSSAVGIFGQSYSGSLFNTIELSEMATLLDTFSLFQFYDRSFEQSQTIRNAEFSGNITSISVTTVPIPSALILFSSSLVGLGMARRKGVL